MVFWLRLGVMSCAFAPPLRHPEMWWTPSGNTSRRSWPRWPLKPPSQNPYVDAIRNNISHLVRVIETDEWSLLRREPPYFLGIVNAVNELEKLVKEQLSSLTGKAVDIDDGLLMPV